MKRLIFLLLCFCCVGLLGCAGGTSVDSFMRAEVDLAYINRLAILPFQNNSGDKYVAERVRDLTTTKLLTTGLVDVVDKGIVNTQLKNEALSLGGEDLDLTTLQRLGQLLTCQAFLIGTIDTSKEIRQGTSSYHILNMTLRLVDSQSGTILWQSTGHRNGTSYGGRLLGLNSDDSFNVAYKLLDEMLVELPFKAYKDVQIPPTEEKATPPEFAPVQE